MGQFQWGSPEGAETPKATIPLGFSFGVGQVQYPRAIDCGWTCAHVTVNLAFKGKMECWGEAFSESKNAAHGYVFTVCVGIS